MEADLSEVRRYLVGLAPTTTGWLGLLRTSAGDCVITTAATREELMTKLLHGIEALVVRALIKGQPLPEPISLARMEQEPGIPPEIEYEWLVLPLTVAAYQRLIAEQCGGEEIH